MLHVDVLQSEKEISDELRTALAAGHLPEKFFYWSPLSVQAWLDLCSEGPYKNFSRSMSLVVAHGAAIARQIPSRTLEVVSLGAGQGLKDLELLKAMRGAGVEVRYLPVDSSQTLLEMAGTAAIAAGFETRALKADISRWEYLAALRDSGTPRLYLLLGNTLGAFDPLEYCGQLGKLLGPADQILLDGEIFSGDDTLAGYDNPLNRTFAFTPLRSLGLSESDGELRFETRTDPRLDGLYLLAKHFRVGRHLELQLGGQVVRFAPGTRLEMNFSYKFSRVTFLRLLSEFAALRTQCEFTSTDGRFLMVLAAPSSPAPSGPMGGEGGATSS